MTKIQIIEAKAFELDPAKNYLICIDSSALTQDDMRTLMEKLDIGNASVAIMVDGDPNTAVKVIESNAK